MIVIKVNYTTDAPIIKVNYDDAPIYISTTVDATYISVDYGTGGGSAAVWGQITGTLSDQTDLQNALDDKVPYTGATGNVDLGEYELKAGQLTLDTTPTGTASVGTTRWNDTIGSSETTLKGGSVILKNGVDLVARVVNKVTPNITLTKAAYQAVRVSGAQGQRLAVAFAQANNDNNSADTIGLVTETIATNQEGFIMTVGNLEEINTTGSLQGETWVDGDVLYLSPTVAGAITNIKPVAPQHIIVIGYVEYAHANHGKIYVKIMNGWELGELHDVDTTGATNGQVLKYNGTIWTPSSDLDTGITSLNGLTALTQTFATGTSGTDFNISSATSTHTFNLPTASAANRGLLSTTDWSTFNNKQDALGYTPVPTTRILTINGTAFDLSADRSWTVSGTNIYTADGTLTGNRTVTMGSNTLSFSGDIFINGLTIGKGGGSISTNTAIGYNALLNQKSNGVYNTAIGYRAGEKLSNTNTGFNSNSTFIGGEAGLNTDYGENNTAIGSRALFTNVTGANNTAIGRNALLNSTVSDLTAVGFGALSACTTGTGNTAVGTGALNSVTTGTNNTAIGINALALCTGQYNSAVGYYSQSKLTTGTENVSIGQQTLFNATTAFNNTAIGMQSLLNLTTGSNNTTLGRQAGNGITTGSNNTIIGAGITGLSSTLSSHILIGDGGGNVRIAFNNSGDCVIGGTSPVPTFAGYKLDVQGTARITGNTIIGASTLGQLLTFTTFGNYAIGVQSAQLQLIVPGSGQRVSLGYGSSASFTSNLDASGNSVIVYPKLQANNIIQSNYFSGLDPTVGGGTGQQIAYYLDAANNYGQGISTLYTGNKYDVWYQVGAVNGGGFRWYRGTTEQFRTTINDNVLIGTSTDVASSILTISSSTKGFLPPRMTTTQKNAIATPAAGLVVYDTTTNKLCCYNGTTWNDLF